MRIQRIDRADEIGRQSVIAFEVVKRLKWAGNYDATEIKKYGSMHTLSVGGSKAREIGSRND